MIEILNIDELEASMKEYQKMFPSSFTSITSIQKTLENDYKEYGGTTNFGISVSKEWEDRCYGFSFVNGCMKPSYVFTGITKC